MESLIAALVEYPVLTLFVVIGLGYLLGQINFFGFRLGIAGVLFAGLAVGALGPRVTVPDIVPSLGLVLFVYAIGLGSGRAFFDAFHRQGCRDNALASGVLILGALITFALGRLLCLPAPTAAGLYCGALTNTPALAAVQERVRTGLPDQAAKEASDQAVVAYGLAYPVGVIGVLLCFQLTRRMWRVRLEPAADTHEVDVRDFAVRNPGVAGRTIGEVMSLHREPGFVVSRIRQADHVDLARSATRLAEGDVVAVVGDEQALRRAEQIFGEAIPARIEADRSDLDYRRVFVSSRNVVGRRLRDLGLPERLSATITRLRRGDVDLVPHGDTRLEFGDRVRVLTHRANFAAISEFFGDSIRGAAELHVGSLAIGMVLGVAVGMLPLPLGGGRTMHLGLAGGTLLVALVLGRLERTGRICWSMPLSANLTLRQIGLLFFLAGVGTRAGWSFLDTLSHSGARLLLAGALVTFVVTLVTLVVGWRLLGIRFDALMGLASGVQTQPACLAYAEGLTRSDVASTAYAAVFPTAMIVKIVVAQWLLG